MFCLTLCYGLVQYSLTAVPLGLPFSIDDYTLLPRRTRVSISSLILHISSSSSGSKGQFGGDRYGFLDMRDCAAEEYSFMCVSTNFPSILSVEALHLS